MVPTNLSGRSIPSLSAPTVTPRIAISAIVQWINTNVTESVNQLHALPLQPAFIDDPSNSRSLVAPSASKNVAFLNEGMVGQDTSASTPVPISRVVRSFCLLISHLECFHTDD